MDERRVEPCRRCVALPQTIHFSLSAFAPPSSLLLVVSQSLRRRSHCRNVRGSPLVHRDAANILARISWRDRHRSFTTIQPQLGSNDLAVRPLCMRRYTAFAPRLDAAWLQRRSVGHAAFPLTVNKRAWLGNEYGGLRKATKVSSFVDVKRSS